jgi:ATP-dependent Zn protease
VRLEVAYHEAGHAVLARVLGLRSGRATLRDHDGRARAYLNPGDSIDGVLAVLGGRAATEELLGYADDFGCSTDDRRALALLMAPGIIEREPWYAKIVRRQLTAQARDLVRRHRGAIERVAHALLARGTLTGAEIDRLAGLGSPPMR